MRHFSALNCFIFSCLLISTQTFATESNNIFSKGSTEINIRYRFENVNQDNDLETAKASTLRTRLGYRTADFNGFSFHAELDDVRSIGADDYTTPNGGPLNTSAGPKQTDHSVIADPQDTKLNQLTLSYTNEDSKLVFGRQRIIRGNSRFVGNVGWRQHEQVFDGISFTSSTIKNLNLFAAYIENRSTITFTDIDQDTFLFDAKYTGIKDADLSAYYYNIKVDNTQIEWENIGARYAANMSGFSYILEYAKQETGSGAKPDYMFVEGSFKFDPVTVSIAFEKLGSNNNTGFATPLATLHKFNGWADQFLGTPSQGLEDKYVKLSSKYKGIKYIAVFHQYDSDVSNIDFGQELNLLASKKLNDNYSIGAKFAYYSAGEGITNKVDAKKFWFWAEAKY